VSYLEKLEQKIQPQALLLLMVVIETQTIFQKTMLQKNLQFHLFGALEVGKFKVLAI
jgi:hypothetical protein